MYLKIFLLLKFKEQDDLKLNKFIIIFPPRFRIEEATPIISRNKKKY